MAEASYGGCPLFAPLADKIGVPLEQLNFLIAQGASLVLALVFRLVLSPQNVSATVRYLVSLILGLLIGFFFYGLCFQHVVFQSILGYLATRLVPQNSMHNVVFVLSLAYLTVIHAKRAFFTPEEVLYRIDITGALMISTQKITALAYSLRDGRLEKKEKMSDLRQKLAMRKLPSVLEYFSYMFYFQGVIVGPLSFFADYKAFIDGTSVQSKIDKTVNNNKPVQVKTPSPYRAVVEKLSIAIFWLCFHYSVKPFFPEMRNSDPEFVRTHGFLYRCYYMLLSMLCCRAKYYVAFTLGDAVCNMAGLGFNGFDENGQSRWDLITNVKIKGIEFATSAKTYIDNWNIQSSLWLRHVCYDRAPFQSRLLTFILSAVWHGLYPGYYLTFVAGWPVTLLAKKMRNCVRSHFQGTLVLRRFYDVVTWFWTQIAISYMVVPFTVLHLKSSLDFYRLNYYWFHILAGILLLMPAKMLGKPPSSSSKTEKLDKNNTQNGFQKAKNTETLNGKKKVKSS